MIKILLFCLLVPALLSAQTHTFQNDGRWLDPANWDTGIVAPDNQVAVVNANAIVDQNTGSGNADNPGRIEIGVGAGNSGSVTVTGGTLSGAHGGNSGIFVGVDGGTGTLTVEEGATYRTQGALMELAIGDFFGGEGFVSVAGVMQVYKFITINNGTFEMLPTGESNLFNSTDLSTIGANGTLSFVIDGPKAGSLERSNSTGLHLNIDPQATLKVTLGGDFALNDSWTLMRYTVLSGQFAQGESFTNEQGYTFAVDYGSGSNDEMVLTLVSDSERPRIESLTATPAAISSGDDTTVAWTASNFDALTLDPGDLDVTGVSEATLSPGETTTYTLTAQRGPVTVSEEITIVVDELPEIDSFTASEPLIAPGESTSLDWSVSGAETVEILPAPGSVSPTGGASLSPAETTTYTLTASNRSGTVTAEVEVVVDAVEAAVIHLWDPSRPGQTGGGFLDSVGGKNFDVTGGTLLTGLTSENTNLTAAMSRVNPAAATGGDMGLGFPSTDTTLEFWVLLGELDDRPQVIFETGSPSEGSAILITSDMVRFLHSTGGVNTIDLEAPFFQINPDDFVQILVTLDAAAGRVELYLKGSGGGVESATADGTVGSPDGRASLFTWSGFGGGLDESLGGTGGVAPPDTTTFQGDIGFARIYDRPLSEAEAEEVYLKIAGAVSESDSDGDGLPDWWENQFIGDLSESASDNNDGDLLNNLLELNNRTDPTLADTDDDGLADHAEIGRDDPTDPTNPDSDDDGLSDGEEVNGNPASNPLEADTDFDGFGDFFEVFTGSDPDDFASVPPADEIGTPSAHLGTLGAGATFTELFGATDTLDATFRVFVDFEEKPTGDREVIFETGGATVGTSLVYEAGNELILRAAGGGGFELAVASHELTESQLAAGELEVVVSYDVLDEGGNSAISLFLDGVLVASDSQPLGGDWTGGNGSSFGVASGNMAGDGQNNPLTGVAFSSGTISRNKGLTYYSDTFFEGGPGLPPAITDLVLDLDNETVSVIFQSEVGKSYTLESSSDLVSFDPVVTDIVAQGESTTAPTISLTETSAYYRVVEE